MMKIVLLLCSLGIAHGGGLSRFLEFKGLSLWRDNEFMRLTNVTKQYCAEQCIAGAYPGCTSFRYKEEHEKCDLLAKVINNKENALHTSVHGWDFYLLQPVCSQGFAYGVGLNRFQQFKGVSMWPDNEFKRLMDVTPEYCAEQCLSGSYPGCTSFRYKTEHQKCDLLAKVIDNKVNVLSASIHGWDIYLLQPGLSRFQSFKGLSLWRDHEYKRFTNVTKQYCAEQCIAGAYPGCTSFRYKEEHEKCDLLAKAMDEKKNALHPSLHGWDIYILQPVCSLGFAHGAGLNQFQQFKGLSYWPDNEFKRLMDVTPTYCAEQCLSGSYPGCTSFRYKPEHQKCDLLAKVIDEKASVLSTSIHGWDFYLLQPGLSRFLKFKGLSLWRDNEFKRLTNVTKEYCAEQCIAGAYPGCTSFRYKEEHQKCDLLAKVINNKENALHTSVHGWDFYLLQPGGW